MLTLGITDRKGWSNCRSFVKPQLYSNCIADAGICVIIIYIHCVYIPPLMHSIHVLNFLDI